MTSNDEKVRAAIAEQAAEWLVANDEGPLDTRDSAALTAWLKASPVHVEEFLGVSVIARDLRDAGTDPEYSLESVLARARAEDDPPVQPLWPRVIAPVEGPILTRLADRRRDDGRARCGESWLVLVVERQAHRARIGTRQHHGAAL